METKDLEQTLQQLLDEAKAQGATAAEADVSIVSGLSVTVRLGEVETVEHNRDRGLGVTVYFGQRKGSASTSDFQPSAVKETVAAACGIAKFTAEDQCAGLADADLMAYGYPDLDLYHPWNVSAERAIELAQVCESAARSADEKISNSEGATASSHASIRAYGNSHGFIGAYRSTRHSLSCSVIAKANESMQRDYWYSTARDAGDLEQAEEVGRQAALRTVRRLNAKRLQTKTVPTLFAAEVAGSLWSHFIGAIRGESLYRRSSFLLDALGQQIFPSWITISEAPHLPRALGSAPFDGEGVVTNARDIVKDGVVSGYVLDSYSARKLGMVTTGNAGGVHNLSVSTHAKTLDELVKDMGEGLLVTELMGQGVNRVTGDYSRGAAGFWVTGGEIQYPVEEITIAGNLTDMFRQIVAVGSDIDVRKNIRTGSVLIEQMTVAGT